MNYTLTTTLSENIFNFLNNESKEKNITKKSIIEKGIEHYRKEQLEKQVRLGLQNRVKEYKKINNDFSSIQFNSIKD